MRHQRMAAEYVAEQINSLILQLDLRQFYCLMFAPSRKLQYAVGHFLNDHKWYSSHL